LCQHHWMIDITQTMTNIWVIIGNFFTEVAKMLSKCFWLGKYCLGTGPLQQTILCEAVEI